MARGGARAGSGRKPGMVGDSRIHQVRKQIQTVAARTNLIPHVDEAIAALTPLEVMQIGMGMSIQDGDWRSAVAIADKMAPYMHTRLAAVEVTHDIRESPREYTLEELERKLAIEQAQLIEIDHYEEDGDQPR